MPSSSRPISTAIAGCISCGTPMVSKSLSSFVGAGEIAHLDRGPHFVLERDPLQLDRQRRHRRFHALETLARLRPFALPRIGERPPQRRVVLVADRRIGEIFERVVGPVHHDLGDGAQHGGGDILRRGGLSSASATSSTPLASGYMSRAI